MYVPSCFVPLCSVTKTDLLSFRYALGVGSVPVFFEGFFPCSLTGIITHIVVGNLVTMWLQFVVMIIIWKFP
jgi:hypothetical protein